MNEVNIVGEERKAKRFRPGLAEIVNDQAKAGTLKATFECKLKKLLDEVQEGFVSRWKEKGEEVIDQNANRLFSRIMECICEEYGFQGEYNSETIYTLRHESLSFETSINLPLRNNEKDGFAILSCKNTSQEWVDQLKSLKDYMLPKGYKVEWCEHLEPDYVCHFKSKHPFDIEDAIGFIKNLRSYIDANK